MLHDLTELLSWCCSGEVVLLSIGFDGFWASGSLSAFGILVEQYVEVGSALGFCWDISAGRLGFLWTPKHVAGSKHTTGIVLLTTNYILLYVGEEDRVFVLRCVALRCLFQLALV